MKSLESFLFDACKTYKDLAVGTIDYITSLGINEQGGEMPGIFSSIKKKKFNSAGSAIGAMAYLGSILFLGYLSLNALRERNDDIAPMSAIEDCEKIPAALPFNNHDY